MSKVSFEKVETILTETLLKIMIERLSELAAIATLMQDTQSKIPEPAIEQILKKFQADLVKMKKNEPKIYKSLELTEEEELEFSGSHKKFGAENWNRLKILKEKIEVLKKELYGQELLEAETFNGQVETERLKHKNKRFNIREGWLPVD
jgi:hypothetical protein